LQRGVNRLSVIPSIKTGICPRNGRYANVAEYDCHIGGLRKAT
jgi:peroxiredoxin